jgi:hypothetical protein
MQLSQRWGLATGQPQRDAPGRRSAAAVSGATLALRAARSAGAHGARSARDAAPSRRPLLTTPPACSAPKRTSSQRVAARATKTDPGTELLSWLKVAGCSGWRPGGLAAPVPLLAARAATIRRRRTAPAPSPGRRPRRRHPPLSTPQRRSTARPSSSW